MLRHGFVMKKSYAAFFSVVILILSTALVRLPCPVCHGTGSMSTAVGLENVTLNNTDNFLLYHVADFCLAYSMFQYSINVVAHNEGSFTAKGWVKCILKGYLKSDVLDIRYVSIEVPPGKEITDNFVVYFLTPFEVPYATRVEVQLEKGEVPCLACEAKGSLPINSWLLVNSMRSTYEKVTRTEQEWVPPIPTEEPGSQQGI
jgi:hypothetical protein